MLVAITFFVVVVVMLVAITFFVVVVVMLVATTIFIVMMVVMLVAITFLIVMMVVVSTNGTGLLTEMFQFQRQVMSTLHCHQQRFATQLRPRGGNDRGSVILFFQQLHGGGQFFFCHTIGTT